MTAYAPGTVAVATVRGVPNVRVMRIARVPHDLWSSEAPVRGHHSHLDVEVTDVRPLVVIDLDRVGNTLDTPAKIARTLIETGIPVAIDIGNAITDQTRLPKPEEPTGLGAVVEDDFGRRFIRQHDGWWRGDEPCTLNWAAVHAVRVLSEGWSE